MTDVSRLPKDEVLYRNQPTSTAGKRAMWRPEQKRIFQLSDLERKVRKDGDLGGDLCVGTYSTANACMLLDQHSTFLESDVDAETLSGAD